MRNKIEFLHIKGNEGLIMWIRINNVDSTIVTFENTLELISRSATRDSTNVFIQKFLRCLHYF